MYAHVARPLFTLNRDLFLEVVGRIERLDPDFRPEGPTTLRWLTGVVGYPAAERIASWWRMMKRTARATP